MTIMGAINKTRKLLKLYKQYDIENKPLITAGVEFNKHDSNNSIQTECRIYVSSIDEGFEGRSFKECFERMIVYLKPRKEVREQDQSDKK